MKLIFLVANNAFVFVCCGELVRLGDAEMFFANRRTAVEAAEAVGMTVCRDGTTLVKVPA